MAVKPTGSVDWATDAGALKIAPSAKQKTHGWTTSDDTISGTPVKPDLQRQNGWQNNVNEWVDYLETTTDDLVNPDPSASTRFITDVTINDVDQSLISVSTDTIERTAHGFFTGDQVEVSSTGTLPTGLSIFTNYFIIRTDDNFFQLAAFPPENAANGIQIDITGQGTGTMTVFTDDHFYLQTTDRFDRYESFQGM